MMSKYYDVVDATNNDTLAIYSNANDRSLDIRYICTVLPGCYCYSGIVSINIMSIEFCVCVDLRLRWRLAFA